MSKRLPIFLGLLLVCFAIWLQTTSNPSVKVFLTRLENLAYDVQLRTKIFTNKVYPSTNVVVIDIDDRSLKAEGRWPWSRLKMTELLDRLTEDGVVVIALDIMFAEKETNIAETLLSTFSQKKLLNASFTDAFRKVTPEFDYDSQLAKNLAQRDSVLGFTFVPYHEISGTLPNPIMELKGQDKTLGFIEWPGYISAVEILQKAAKGSGFINVIPDQDGIIRRVPLLMRYHDAVYPSLALEAVKLYLLSNIELITKTYGDELELEGIQLADHVIPVDAHGQLLVPFRGKSFTFPFYSATDILNKKITKDALAGKIAFIGTSAIGLGDLRGTAVEGVYPGVEVQATVADGILTDYFFSKPAWTSGAEISFTVLLGVLLAFLFPYLGPRVLILLIIFIPMSLVMLNNALWDRTGLIISILIPILLTIGLSITNTVYGYLFETRRREKIKEMFGQYVPEGHIDSMLTAQDSFALKGEDREMSVLFADIRNFTTLSEPMSATELKDLLNEFFTPMTEIIFKYKGTIDKYIGDLIMAFWGAPLRDHKHIEHALSAALEMLSSLQNLNKVFIEKGWPKIVIGIGINSGIMSVGDMGSQFRRNYTVIGDAVNLASRIEGLTKFYGVDVIVPENMQVNQKQFLFRELDRVVVKGKTRSIAIYQLIAKKTDASQELLQEVQQSDKALALYFQQQWDEALQIFNELHASYPKFPFYKIYIERILEFKKNPPHANWDGVYTHANK